MDFVVFFNFIMFADKLTRDMATIRQFQNELTSKAKRNLIEHELGKDLIQRIESEGGELKIYSTNPTFEFLNVSADLQHELDKKMSVIESGLKRWKFD